MDVEAARARLSIKHPLERSLVGDLFDPHRADLPARDSVEDLADLLPDGPMARDRFEDEETAAHARMPDLAGDDQC